MNIRQKTPDLFLFDMGRSVNNGVVVGIVNDIDFDYTFNAASKATFSVRKYIYDLDSCKWILNPCYDKISQYNVIATTDTENKYHFYGSELKEYGLGTQVVRNANATGLGFNARFNNASLRNETELFDIGTHSGYKWKYFYYINQNDGGIYNGNGCGYIAVDEFFPVQAGDIIAYGSMQKNGSGSFSYSDNQSDVIFRYQLFFYNEPNASGYVSHTNIDAAPPVRRIRVKKDDLGGQNSGYVRVGAIASQSHSNNDGSWYSYCPGAGYVKIYSGERYCTSFSVTSKTDRYLPEQWWVIDSCEESGDGYNTIKTVSLYSYEYTLSYKTFSTSEETLPLFIPDEITDIVTGLDANGDPKMIVDMVSNETRSDGTYKEFKLKQRMARGLVNQILDYLPNWSIGYISNSIGTRYRTVGDVDNDNIYSYLMNTVQPTYQCFIFYDTNNLKISLISYEDMIGYLSSNTPHFKTSSVLTWQNAIKSLKVTNQDSNFITAMRLHSASDEYSIGLVNPTGNNVVYNFDSIKDELNYVVDSEHMHNGVRYTLKEVIDLYQQTIKDVISGSNRLVYSTSYLSQVEDYLSAIQRCVELESKIKQTLAEHKSIVDRIRIYIEDDGLNGRTYPASTWYMSQDSPRTLSSIKSGGTYAPISQAGVEYANYHSKSMYNDYYAIVETYWGTKEEFDSVKSERDKLKKQLKEISTYFSLDYNTVVKDRQRIRTSTSDMYYPIFTPAEILVLNKYIFEGDWRDNNAIFNEEYSASDVVTTLRSLYNAGKKDLDDIYSKRNYDFELNTIDIFSDKNMRENIESIYLGNCTNVSNFGNWVTPVLLGIHTTYSNDKNDFSMSFSTDYKRKPIELRFSKLFGTINQVSPSSSEIVYDD